MKPFKQFKVNNLSHHLYNENRWMDYYGILITTSLISYIIAIVAILILCLGKFIAGFLLIAISILLCVFSKKIGNYFLLKKDENFIKNK